MRLILISALGMCALAACKMGPDYTRPETVTGDSWRIASATSESIANLPWWELLKDPALHELIRTALQQNQDVRVAAAAVREFRAQVIISRFDLAPSLDYSGTGLFFKTQSDAVPIPVGGASAVQIPGLAGGSNTITAQSGMGLLKWELDLWGRIRRSIDAAQAQLLSRGENQRTVILELVSAVSQAYFDLRQLDLQVDISQRTLASWDETLKISQVKMEHGVISKLDLDRFEAERAGTASQLADFERQVVQKENQLNLLLGRRPSGIVRGLALTDQLMPPSVPAGLPSDLLARRPDILQAEQELAAATATIGIAQAQRFPAFSLTGALGISSTQLSSLSIGPSFMQAAIGSLSGPLLNATALGYQVKVAEARAEQASIQYEKAIMTAFKEVEDALIAVQKTREQREAQEVQVTSLRSAFSLAELRYQGGRASYLDVLIAQRDRFNAELALASTRRAELVSVVLLYKALGGGWSPENPNADESAPGYHESRSRQASAR
ncbi:MAG: ttgC [Nitrospira sp.]|jgi:multidrug efflux system outer membrane protein|nr:ttgC [Nitrospira sp.]